MLQTHRIAPGALAAAIALAAATAGAAGSAGVQVATQSPAKPSSRLPTPPALPTTTEAATPCGRVEMSPVVQIPVGKSTVIRPKTPVTRILLGNPENARAARPTETPAQNTKEEGVAKAPTMDTRPGVADVDVLLLGPTEVYLLGKSIGSTNVVMLDREGVCTAFDVVVAMDTSGLQASLALLLPNEKDIHVAAAFDSIVLSGTVSDSGALQRATDLASAYVRREQGASDQIKLNPRVVVMLDVAAPQQVMLEVKVAEVSKSLLDQFGIDFSRAYTTADGGMLRYLTGILGGGIGQLGQLSGTGPNGVPYSSIDAVIGGQVPIPGISGGNVTVTYDSQGRPIYTTTYGTVPARNVSAGTLNMQKTDGLVKVLAEPTIMAISGQTGSFLAGGKVLIPVAQSGSNGVSSVTLQEEEFGVSVTFTPTVLGNGRINLHVKPEVSDLNQTGTTISAPGITQVTVLPTFSSRKAETTVQLMDGQSFAIGGLIKNNVSTSIAAFPFLGEIPILGSLFRSTQFQTDKTELVFVVTPRLVAPLPTNYRLPTDNFVPPTRSELILGGQLEGKAPPPADPGSAAPDAATAPPAAPAGGGFDNQPKAGKS